MKKYENKTSLLLDFVEAAIVNTLSLLSRPKRVINSLNGPKDSAIIAIRPAEDFITFQCGDKQRPNWVKLVEQKAIPPVEQLTQ